MDNPRTKQAALERLYQRAQKNVSRLPNLGVSAAGGSSRANASFVRTTTPPESSVGEAEAEAEVEDRGLDAEKDNIRLFVQPARHNNVQCVSDAVSTVGPTTSHLQNLQLRACRTGNGSEASKYGLLRSHTSSSPAALVGSSSRNDTVHISHNTTINTTNNTYNNQHLHDNSNNSNRNDSHHNYPGPGSNDSESARPQQFFPSTQPTPILYTHPHTPGPGPTLQGLLIRVAIYTICTIIFFTLGRYLYESIKEDLTNWARRSLTPRWIGRWFTFTSRPTASSSTKPLTADASSIPAAATTLLGAAPSQASLAQQLSAMVGLTGLWCRWNRTACQVPTMQLGSSHASALSTTGEPTSPPASPSRPAKEKRQDLLWSDRVSVLVKDVAWLQGQLFFQQHDHQKRQPSSASASAITSSKTPISPSFSSSSTQQFPFNHQHHRNRLVAHILGPSTQAYWQDTLGAAEAALAAHAESLRAVELRHERQLRREAATATALLAALRGRHSAAAESSSRNNADGDGGDHGNGAAVTAPARWWAVWEKWRRPSSPASSPPPLIRSAKVELCRLVVQRRRGDEATAAASPPSSTSPSTAPSSPESPPNDPCDPDHAQARAQGNTDTHSSSSSSEWPRWRSQWHGVSPDVASRDIDRVVTLYARLLAARELLAAAVAGRQALLDGLQRLQGEMRASTGGGRAACKAGEALRAGAQRAEVLRGEERVRRLQLTHQEEEQGEQGQGQGQGGQGQGGQRQSGCDGENGASLLGGSGRDGKDHSLQAGFQTNEFAADATDTTNSGSDSNIKETPTTQEPAQPPTDINTGIDVDITPAGLASARDYLLLAASQADPVCEAAQRLRAGHAARVAAALAEVRWLRQRGLAAVEEMVDEVVEWAAGAMSLSEARSFSERDNAFSSSPAGGIAMGIAMGMEWVESQEGELEDILTALIRRDWG